MKNKLVIFSAFYEPHLGGVERYVKELSKALEKKDYEIIIITSDTDDKGFIETDGDIKVFRLKHIYLIDERLPVPYSFKEIKYIIKNIGSFNPSGIILNMRIYPLSLLGAFIAKKLKIQAILIDHTSGYFEFNSKIKVFFAKKYEQLCNFYLKKNISAFYGVSEKVNHWLNNFGINSKGIIYNGVSNNFETEKWNGSLIKRTDNDFIIFFAGRLITEKGVEFLLE